MARHSGLDSDSDNKNSSSHKQPDSRRQGSPGDTTKRVSVIEQSGDARPYMRGIMVHSLTAKGLSFDDAYATAYAVGDRIRDRSAVSRTELGDLVQEILGDQFDPEQSVPAVLQIEVEDEHGTSPFSKALLAQSLLAATIEIDEAYVVAREIEGDLVRRRQIVIAQKDLRRLAYGRLLDRFGDRVAERYLAWRVYQDPEIPVMILLGGTTGVGKTSLALALSQRLGISRVLSTDSIRHIMRIMLSRELMPTLHASSFDAYREVSAAGEDPVIEGFVSQAATVAVGVTAILDRAVEENQSLVLDGVSLVPGQLDLKPYRGKAHIFHFIIGRLDEQGLRRHFEIRPKRQKQRTADRYLASLDEILRIQDYLLEQAEHFDVPIIDNVSIDHSAQLVIRNVVDSLRKGIKDKLESLV